MGTPRTCAIIEQLSTRASWNPSNKDITSLYEESKGCVRPPICPRDIQAFCLDALHNLLNMQRMYSTSKMFNLL